MGSPSVPDPCASETLAESLRALLDQTAKPLDKKSSIQAILSSAPDHLIPAALFLLRSERNATRRREIYTTLVDYPEFLLQVVRPDVQRGKAIEICHELMRVDGLFDVRLAHLLPRRYEGECNLDTATVTRVLDILHEISAGPRLILLLNHLTHSANQQIASKATMLIAQRMQNNQAVENYLASDDPRVRASTVEALWGIKTPFARRTMKACLQDPNNRVAGNALFGLFLLDDQSVNGLVERMLRDERPMFRATAAWIMGQIGKPEFRDSLQQALKDRELSVRQAARRALKTIHQAVLAAQPLAPEPVVVAAPFGAPESVTCLVAADEALAPEAPTEVTVEVPVAVAQEELRMPEPVPPSAEKPPEPADDGFEIHLDGSYTGSRRRR